MNDLMSSFSDPAVLLGLGAAVALLAGIGLGMALRQPLVTRLSKALDEEKARAEDHLAKLGPARDERDAAVAEQHQAALATTKVEEALRGAEIRLTDLNADLIRVRHERDALRRQTQELRTALSRLEAQQAEREQQHQSQLKLLNENRENLKKEFENLANRIFDSKGKQFSDTSKASVEAMLKPFREQIAGFQARVNEVHSESLKGNTALEAEIRKVLDVGLAMNDQASNLAQALKGDKKTTGNWGETQLQRTLEFAGLENGVHYELQAAFKDGEGKRKLPDCLIKLPDGKHMVVDSKVSLVDYDRATSAETDEERKQALTSHVRAVRNHIDDLSSKGYSDLPGIESPSFVLMFMPIEPAYIEAMKNSRELFDYGYKRNVVMVSHTTLLPILRTVSNLWMAERSNAEARAISESAGEIYNQVCLVAERLQKLGGTLHTVSNHYNDAVTGLVGKQGLYGKVDRFQQLSARASKTLPDLEPQHLQLDDDRLGIAQGTDKPGKLGHKPGE